MQWAVWSIGWFILWVLMFKSSNFLSIFYFYRDVAYPSTENIANTHLDHLLFFIHGSRIHFCLSDKNRHYKYSTVYATYDLWLPLYTIPHLIRLQPGILKPSFSVCIPCGIFSSTFFDQENELHSSTNQMKLLIFLCTHWIICSQNMIFHTFSPFHICVWLPIENLARGNVTMSYLSRKSLPLHVQSISDATAP